MSLATQRRACLAEGYRVHHGRKAADEGSPLDRKAGSRGQALNGAHSQTLRAPSSAVTYLLQQDHTP